MADSNRVTLATSTALLNAFSTGSPSTADLTKLRFTGESLKRNTTSVESAEIRDDRAIADLIRTNIGADGDINWELSYSTYDNYFQMAFLSSAWTAAVTNVASTDTTINGTTGAIAATVDSPLAGLAVGDIVRVTETGANAGVYYARITTWTDAKNGILTPPPPAAIATAVLEIERGAYLQQATTLWYTHIEKLYGDIGSTNEFEQFIFATVNQLQMTIPTEGIITGSFSMLGRNCTTGDTTIGDGSYTAQTTTEVLNSITGVNAFWVDNVEINQTQFSLSLNNNLRARNVIGLLGAESIGTGSAMFSGSLQAYYSSAAQYILHENFTAASITCIQNDPTGNAYAWDIPRVKFGTGQRVAGGKNQDVIADLTWTGMISTLYTGDQRQARLYRWAA